MCRPLRLLLLGLLLLVGGCGGGGDGDADPAAAIPADVAFYVEATLQPDGEQADAIEAVAERLGVGDPGELVLDALETSIAESGDDVSYEDDIEPWLGNRVGAGATTFDDDPKAVIALSVTDADRARSFLEESEGDDAGTTEIGGVDAYEFREGGFIAVVGDYMLAGEERALFERAVALADGGDGESLADTERYEAATDRLPDDRVGTLFFEADALAEELLRDPEYADPESRREAERVLGRVESFAGAVFARDDAVVTELRVGVTGATDALPGSTELLSAVPADVLGAFGFGEVGRFARTLIEELEPPGALDQAGREAGLDIDRELLAWIGDVALFARAGGSAGYDGALVVEATDPGLAERSLEQVLTARDRTAGPARELDVAGADRAWEAIPAGDGLPAAAILALAGDRVIVGIGRDAVEAALAPGRTLGDEDRFAAAAELLDGLAPVAVLDVAGGVRAAGALALSAVPPEAGRALGRADRLVVGAGRDGDALVARVALTLR